MASGAEEYSITYEFNQKYYQITSHEVHLQLQSGKMIDLHVSALKDIYIEQILC